MRVTLFSLALLPAGLFAVLALSQCRSGLGKGPNAVASGPSVLADLLPGLESEEVIGGCDPDGRGFCPETWYICYDQDGSAKLCISRDPVVPTSDGDWDCAMSSGEVSCVGDEMPGQADSGWDCIDDGDGSVFCELGGEVPYPGTYIDGEWNCYTDEGYVVCEAGDTQDFFGGGDTPEDTPGDDTPPPGDNEEACICVPGAHRYCDTREYCNWGEQRCKPNGMEWTECEETFAPVGCEDVSPARRNGSRLFNEEAQACCVEMGFCCQDFHDNDGDDDKQESIGVCEEPAAVCSPIDS